MFHHDNAKPYDAKIASENIEEFNWEKNLSYTLLPRPHSSNYHLLQNHLDGLVLESP